MKYQHASKIIERVSIILLLFTYLFSTASANWASKKAHTLSPIAQISCSEIIESYNAKNHQIFLESIIQQINSIDQHIASGEDDVQFFRTLFGPLLNEEDWDHARIFLKKLNDQVPSFSKEEVWINYLLGRLNHASYFQNAAQYHLTLADSICRTREIDSGICMANKFQLARVLTYARKTHAAQQNLNAVKRYALDIQNTNLYNYCILQESIVAYKEKDFRKALRISEQAYGYFSCSKHPYFALESLNQLSGNLVTLDFLDEGKARCNELLRKAEHLIDTSFLIQAYVTLSEAAIRNDEILLSKTYIKAARELHTTMDPIIESIILKKEQNLALYQNDWEASYLIMLQWHDLMRFFDRKGESDAIEEIELSFSAKQKQHELELLKTQSQLHIQKSKLRLFTLGAFSLFLLATVIMTFIRYRLKKRTYQKIIELDQFKTKILTNISHELRTPLSLIKAPLELSLQKEVQSEDEMNRLLIMHRNVNRLETLVEEVLDLASFEMRQKILQVEENDANSHFSFLFSNFESLALVNDQIFLPKIHRLQTLIWYDKKILETITYNLISNALKYCPAGSTIQANAVMDEKELVLSIKDDGPGIPQALQKRIFERFFRNELINTNAEGLGIGLALVKELVELHKGSITLHSTPDIGSTFRVTIPTSKEMYFDKETCISEIDFPINTGKQNAPFAGESGKSLPIILIVEDNRDMQKHLSTLLGQYYKIYTASNGKHGLEIAQDLIPDLIISDMMMPIMNGNKMCQLIKEDEKISHIPIIILTAKATESDKLSMLNCGVNDYLLKPFNNDEIILKTRNHLSQVEEFRKRFQAKDIPHIISTAKNKGDLIFWQRLNNVIKHHLTDSDFGVEAFSRKMLMSRMQLHRKLKALTGMSTSAYLRCQRIKASVELLQIGDLTVSEVAYDSGFSSPSYFSKCFKENIGISPREYIKSKTCSNS